MPNEAYVPIDDDFSHDDEKFKQECYERFISAMLASNIKSEYEKQKFAINALKDTVSRETIALRTELMREAYIKAADEIMICPKCGNTSRNEEGNYCCRRCGSKLVHLYKCEDDLAQSLRREGCGANFAGISMLEHISFCPSCGRQVSDVKKAKMNVIEPRKIYTGQEEEKKKSAEFVYICSYCGTVHEDERIKCGTCGKSVIKRSKQEADSLSDKTPSPKLQIEVMNVPAEKIQPLCRPGDIIYLGNYPFDKDGSKKPIEWIVVDKDQNNIALLLSRYCLQEMKYNEEEKEISWGDCSLRSWLNSEFYNASFSQQEQKGIVPTEIDTIKEGSIFTRKKITTNDKVFILSKEEILKYFPLAENRKIFATPYANMSDRSAGIRMLHSRGEKEIPCVWYLRCFSRGITRKAELRNEKRIITEIQYEQIGRAGDILQKSISGISFVFVRPALKFDLTKLQ